MDSFDITIFGNGKTEINGSEFSINVKTIWLTSVQSLIDAVWSKKPVNSRATQPFFAIGIVKYSVIVYINNDCIYTLETDDTLKPLVKNLYNELKVIYNYWINPSPN